MPTIEKRISASGEASYRAKVRLRGHAPLTKTFERKRDAEQWARAQETDINRGNLISTEAERTTLREALERYLKEQTPQKKGWRREQDRIRAWMAHPLSHRFLAQLRGSDFANYRDKRREAGKAENTIRLELALISRLYKVAGSDWGMEGLRNPIRSVTMPSGSNERDRRLDGDEEARLLAELGQLHPYMPALCGLAIETAMRQGELLTLTWADVDLTQRFAKLRDTKNSESRYVPLSTRALQIISGLPRGLNPNDRLFPLSQDTAIRLFRQACVNAGIENLKFHDLRHEATSRICDKLPMHEAMRITGHKTPAMMMRYYHPRPEDLARKLG